LGLRGLSMLPFASEEFCQKPHCLNNSSMNYSLYCHGCHLHTQLEHDQLVTYKCMHICCIHAFRDIQIVGYMSHCFHAHRDNELVRSVFESK
jgi:hypothetical protein